MTASTPLPVANTNVASEAQADSVPSPAAQAVARYYDATTRLFLRADTARAGTIHRRVWAPGVDNANDAAEYVHRVLAEALGDRVTDVLDLGCGVGATSLWLSEKFARITDPLRITGVTISKVQHAIACAEALRRDRSADCTFIEADFMRLGDVLPAASFDAAFSIEAFIHAPDASVFFAEAARVIRPRGRLFLCDDFLTELAPPDHPILDRLRRGWHANSLLTPRAVAEHAARHGWTLSGDRDWTPYLRLQSEPLLEALAASGAALAALPGVRGSAFMDNWIGGTALQRATHRGWLGYRFLFFERGGVDRPRDPPVHAKP